MSLDVTPADMARWPFETRVLWEQLTEEGWEPSSWPMPPDASSVHLYRLVNRNRMHRFWGAEWEARTRLPWEWSDWPNFDLEQKLLPVSVEPDEQDRRDAESLVAAINAPPRFRVGDILDVQDLHSSITPLRVAAGTTATSITIDGQTLYLEPAPINVTVAVEPRRRARENLQRARPQRRLDGRRQ